MWLWNTGFNRHFCVNIKFPKTPETKSDKAAYDWEQKDMILIQIKLSKSSSCHSLVIVHNALHADQTITTKTFLALFSRCVIKWRLQFEWFYSQSVHNIREFQVENVPHSKDSGIVSVWSKQPQLIIYIINRVVIKLMQPQNEAFVENIANFPQSIFRIQKPELKSQNCPQEAQQYISDICITFSFPVMHKNPDDKICL